MGTSPRYSEPVDGVFSTTTASGHWCAQPVVAYR
jgi:hypothetical protein